MGCGGFDFNWSMEDVRLSVAYSDFIEAKRSAPRSVGIEGCEINQDLYMFQQEIVSWALELGSACIFADCGLGKTLMQLEWAHHVSLHTSGPVLILAPLAVSAQTIREGARFGYGVLAVDDPQESPIRITNYEQLHNIDISEYSGIVLDESSILKSHTGKFRNELITMFREFRFRLACTATPSPNDVMELGNHAEFVGAMTRTEMLAMYFVHDGGETQKWRLKGHANDEFWRWVTTWAMVISKPSDLGYDDAGYELPELMYHTRTVESSSIREGMLFNEAYSPTLTERRESRKVSMADRCEVAANLANESTEQWVMWCDLNSESETLANLIPDAVEVRGSDTNNHKSDSMMDFADGKIRVLVTKPKIGGFGMNWQNCRNMAFVGLSDSYEALYQSTRRCWRFGQDKEVRAYIITSTSEGAVLQNVLRKERDHQLMQDRMRRLTHKPEIAERIEGGEVTETTGQGWTLKNGDCVEVLKGLESASVDYSIFSPPFASLYTYSDSPQDMGNCENKEEFYEHFAYLAPELLRVTKPGRLLSFHCMLLPTSKVRDGVIGLTDFRGDLIRMFEESGWIYHSEVCIWKDPVTAMQRTKALGLLHKTIRKDSAMSRQGVPDYVVTMRKPGDNAEPISHDASQFPVSLWQKWASPIWSDINPNDTIQFRAAREESDERHICPLQLEVIRRCLGLWTNPNDLVLSPFAGIGSEGYEALRHGRRFIGAELKTSYYDLAVKNLRYIEEDSQQSELFA